MRAGNQFLEQLLRAVNDHDLDRIVHCFTTDYENETPAHPGRGFKGRDQVRINWDRILTGVPDLRADVLRWVAVRDEVWSEWEMGGMRIDRVPQMLRGVIIFGVEDQRARWARFYLEPVGSDEGGVNLAVTKVTEGEAS